MSAAPIAIALGSNLGDREAHLRDAVGQLGRVIVNLRVSPFVETAPVGVDEPQPPYLNAVAIGETTLAPRALLETLLTIERAHGRTRPSFRASRTLDLDLILYASLAIDDDDLVVPHPRFRERQFVLEPLAALAPEWIDPVSRKPVRDLWRDWQQRPRRV